MYCFFLSEAASGALLLQTFLTYSGTTSAYIGSEFCKSSIGESFFSWQNYFFNFR